MKNRPTIIGIDGGASKVSTHVIEVLRDGKSFVLGKENSVKEYHNYPDFQSDFTPASLPTQLEQIQNDNVIPTLIETKQSKAYYEAFSDAIWELVNLTNSENILIGIGMPGIKTVDERGIVVMANGPRMPNFSLEIERRLSDTNISLAAPIFKLGSDADYCGIGEEYAEMGSFHNTENAYYLGGGTGVADALKLHGKLISFDKYKDWIAKTWEMSDENGKSMEIFCSANGIQSIYSNMADISQTELNKNDIYLDQIFKRSTKEDQTAITTWQIVINKLSLLLYERITTIYSGWQNIFTFINHKNPPLDTNHIFKNTLLDRIVIGQRLGFLFKNPLAQKYLIEPLVKNLSELISNSKSLDGHAKSHYLINGKFDSKIIIASQLRDAPALGAGIDAWQTFKNDY